MITASHLRKEYRVFRRPPGLRSALRSLWKRTYEKVVAVDDVSFSIAEGERVGFLGPNGAGKTTTLKMLSGLLHPTAGEATVAGFTPRLRQAELLRTITLVMGQKQQLLWDLPPSETFALNRAVFGVPERQFRDTLDELTTLLGLGSILDKPTRQLSLGERMRCELAAALIHRPKVLFLDEPTIGLDVAMQLAIRDFIRQYNQRHRATVMLTSHYMDDVVALCPRVIVIDGGHLVHDGDLRALVKSTDPDKRVSCTLPAEIRDDQLARLGTFTRDGARAQLRLPESALADAVRTLLSGLHATDLSIEDPPLEDVMRTLFTRTSAPRAASPMDPPAAAVGGS